MNRPIDPEAGLSDMEKFARQTAEAAKVDQRRRSSSGDKKKGGKSPWKGKSNRDTDPNFGSDFSSGGKKQETVFKTGLVPEVAEEYDETQEKQTAFSFGSIEESERELDLHLEKKKREGLGGFFRAVSGKTREEKKKKERRKDRSSSVPNRRQSAPSGVGELNFKPRPSGDSAQSPPPAPNYAQKNSNMPPDKGKDKPSDDDTQTLTFKPPSVPSMADEDDYADFVLEVKCLDTGKVEQVDHKTGGLAGISWSERQRIRGSIVLGEKLLAEKIAQFKTQVGERRTKIKSSMKRRTTWGGKKKGKASVKDVNPNVGELPTSPKAKGQEKEDKNSELTFKLSSQPYHPDEIYEQQKE